MEKSKMMKAPNGKPSNLTPEQYRLVRTPAFKKWFGDWENSPETASKVVDDNGEPLVVYHGSPKNFNTFDVNLERGKHRRQYSLKGNYFAKDEWTSRQYAGSDGYVKKYFLNARKILTKGTIDKEIIIESLNSIRQTPLQESTIKNLFVFDNIDDFIEDIGQKSIILSGYDGVIDNNEDFIVFSSNQIKLADGTNTTFNSNNPDIRYKNGGGIKKLAFIQKNENGFYWLYSINDKGDYYKEVDGDKRLYVVKDMAKRWGYKLVTTNEFNDYYKIPERVRRFDDGGTTNNNVNLQKINMEKQKYCVVVVKFDNNVKKATEVMPIQMAKEYVKRFVGKLEVFEVFACTADGEQLSKIDDIEKYALGGGVDIVENKNGLFGMYPENPKKTNTGVKMGVGGTMDSSNDINAPILGGTMGSSMRTGGKVKQYEDLSRQTAQVVNDSGETTSVPEIDINLVDKTEFDGKGLTIRSSVDAYDIFKKIWDAQKISVQEEMNVLFLNKANVVIGYYRHSTGGIDGTVIDKELISGLAVKSLSKGVVIAHNHPSGNLTPSQADIKVTKDLKDALKLFEITLLDSLIITKESYYSLADEGKFELGGVMRTGGNVEEVDLFETINALPIDVQEVLMRFSDKDIDYDSCKELENELKPFGYTFEYGLDAEPYGLRLIMKDENNTNADEPQAEDFKQMAFKYKAEGDKFSASYIKYLESGDVEKAEQSKMLGNEAYQNEEKARQMWQKALDNKKMRKGGFVSQAKRMGGNRVIYHEAIIGKGAKEKYETWKVVFSIDVIENDYEESAAIPIIESIIIIESENKKRIGKDLDENDITIEQFTAVDNELHNWIKKEEAIRKDINDEMQIDNVNYGSNSAEVEKEWGGTGYKNGGNLKKAADVQLLIDELTAQKKAILRGDGMPNNVTRMLDAKIKILKEDVIRYSNGGSFKKKDNDDISQYYDNEFAVGTFVPNIKQKQIITDKIGLSESSADYLIDMSPKFAVWLADIIVKDEIRDYKVGLESGVQVEATEPQIKQYVLNRINERNNWISTNYSRGIRQILDWLMHPSTPKQNLKELTFIDAFNKAEMWHEELKTLGGDIDYKEPEENEIIKRYPTTAEGAEYYWVLIPKSFCDVESRRMGHCGRTGASHLISLRSIVPYGKGHTLTDSHVTIAWDEDEALFFQVKGKKNQKPSVKYHDYIFDLIKDFAKDEDNKFKGFGVEYDPKQDYGFDDMSKEQILELYKINKHIFNGFEGECLLYEIGISKEKPNTIVKIEKPVEYVGDLLNLDRNFDSKFIEKILTGDYDEDMLDNWGYYYHHYKDFIDNLDKENKERIVKEIMRITKHTKKKVLENGIYEYTLGNVDDFHEDEFDNIVRAMVNAITRAEEQEYVNYYYKQIKSALEELGTVKLLNYDGAFLEVDLSDSLTNRQISGYLKNLEISDVSEGVFFEAMEDGEIETPKLSFDDRYSPYVDNKEFNASLKEIDLQFG